VTSQDLADGQIKPIADNQKREMTRGTKLGKDWEDAIDLYTVKKSCEFMLVSAQQGSLTGQIVTGTDATFDPVAFDELPFWPDKFIEEMANNVRDCNRPIKTTHNVEHLFSLLCGN
jgi:hypothetical protein